MNSDIRKLKHTQAEGFLNEFADQVVGTTFGGPTPSDAKVSLTFGRDQATIISESLTPIAENTFTTSVTPEDFEMVRVDFANITMGLAAAERLRDLLSGIIETAKSQIARQQQ